MDADPGVARRRHSSVPQLPIRQPVRSRSCSTRGACATSRSGSGDIEALANRRRSMLGAPQEAWLFNELRASQRAGTAWRLLGQQVMFSRLGQPGRGALNADSWDGYQAARDRIVEFLTAERMRGRRHTQRRPAQLVGIRCAAQSVGRIRAKRPGLDRGGAGGAGNQLAAALHLARDARPQRAAARAPAAPEISRRGNPRLRGAGHHAPATAR